MDLSKAVDPNGIINNLLANLLWVPIVALTAIAYRGLRRLLRWGGLSARWKTLASVALVFACLIWWVPRQLYLTICVAYVALSVLVWMSFRGLANVGILDAHRSVKVGVGFSASLRTAQTSISFLGIGADKLTKEKDFEGAITRCAGAGRSARFLLSPIDNPLLEQMAMQHNLRRDEYKDRVRDSIKRLAALKLRRGLNIEVRQYNARSIQDMQQFRLVFLNDATCLLSWTVWGSHAGTENPQIILDRGSGTGRDRRLYAAFQAHFDALWEESTPVDLAHA